MKNTIKTALGALAIGVSAWVLLAQDPGGPGRTGEMPPDSHPARRGPVPLVIRALDANHDGVVDAQEITNAPVVLRKLDRSGDGKLDLDELMGPPPQPRGGAVDEPGPENELPPARRGEPK